MSQTDVKVTITTSDNDESHYLGEATDGNEEVPTSVREKPPARRRIVVDDDAVVAFIKDAIESEPEQWDIPTKVLAANLWDTFGDLVMKQAAGTPVLESPTRLNMEWLKLHVDCLEFLRSKRGKPARIALVNSVGRSRERAAEAPNKTILPSGVAMEYSDAVTTLFKETAAPTNENAGIIKHIVLDLLRAIRQKSKTQDVRVHAYGSAVNGLGSRGRSDIDLCVSGFAAEPNEDGSVGRRKKSTAIRKLSKILRRLKSIRIKEVIAHARVPILNFNYLFPSHNGVKSRVVECDLCCDGMLAVYNTQLFRCYADFDTRVRPVIFAVKEWANRRKIKDASVGFLSSYSFVLMVIYFLQMGVSPPILPHLQSEELTKTTSNIFVIDHGDESGATATAHPRTVIAGFDCTFCGNADAARALLAAKHNSANTMTVGELLGRFFYFYAFQFDHNKQSIDIRSPAILERRPGSRLDIQDPFEDRNVARTLCGRNTYKKLFGEFRRAAELLCGTTPDGTLTPRQPEGGPKSLHALFVDNEPTVHSRPQKTKRKGRKITTPKHRRPKGRQNNGARAQSNAVGAGTGAAPTTHKHNKGRTRHRAKGRGRGRGRGHGRGRGNGRGNGRGRGGPGGRANQGQGPQ